MPQVIEFNKPGPWVGKVLEKQIDWQLEDPHLTKQQCIQRLLQNVEQFLNK